MLHTSLVPTMIEGGYRYNVIPSEAKAIVDVRLHPEEDQKTFLDRVRAVVNDPRVEVRWFRDPYRPAGASRLNTEAYSVLQAQLKAHYAPTALPMMGTGATDMSQVRSKGVQCYGIGPAIDAEDAGKGFGAHSDQERILESELHRFVRFLYDVVTELARRLRATDDVHGLVNRVPNPESRVPSPIRLPKVLRRLLVLEADELDQLGVEHDLVLDRHCPRPRVGLGIVDGDLDRRGCRSSRA